MYHALMRPAHHLDLSKRPRNLYLIESYGPRAFQRRAGRLLTLTTTPWRSLRVLIGADNQTVSGESRPPLGRESKYKTIENP